MQAREEATTGEKMKSGRDKYEHPLVERYASKEMSHLWSPQKKFSTWRRLWLALAEGEQELGLNITEEQLVEMRGHLDDIDFELAEEMEGKFRHDVMAVSRMFCCCHGTSSGHQSTNPYCVKSLTHTLSLSLSFTHILICSMCTHLVLLVLYPCPLFTSEPRAVM